MNNAVTSRLRRGTRPGARAKSALKLACALMLASALPAAAQTPGLTSSFPAQGQGGGFTGSGLVGQYYNNVNFAGTPVFTRTDDRLDYIWPLWNNTPPNAVSGTSGIPFPDTNFSVKWTGQIIAKFSETYTFSTVSDDGIKVIVNGQTLINNLTNHPPTTDTGSITLQAGQKYSIEVDYFQGGGGAQMQLFWQSPSTPKSIIEPATPIGIDVQGTADYDAGLMFADAVKQARFWDDGNGKSIRQDASGWPLADGRLFLWDSALMAGTYQLVFNGQASSVSIGVWGWDNNQCSVTGLQYNAATNTSTATVSLNGNLGWGQPGGNSTWLTFTGTARDDGSGQAGVTNVKLMRPTTQGGTTSFPVGTLFNTNYTQLLSHFDILRFMDYLATNGNAQKTWADRTLPGQWSQQTGATPAGAWEYAIELCNETGKDAYINIPEQADNTYITNLANMFKYGSDGVNAYTGPQTNPVYPPLNPNLHIYIEYANEVWNGSFAQNGQNNSAADAAVSGGTALGLLLNYDGQAGVGSNALHQRYQAERTKETSDIFRQVFGDAAMGAKIRPILEWQYGGGWYGDEQLLKFLNGYYNGGGGQPSEPVGYFLWGGGGGWYDSTTNGEGLGEVTVPDQSFENGGQGWTFSSGGSVITATNAPDGTHVAQLPPGASMTTTFTSPYTDRAAISLQIDFPGRTNPSQLPTTNAYQVYLDGQLFYTRNQYFSWNTLGGYAQDELPVFTLTQGQHTLQIVNVDTTDTNFVENFDQVLISTINAHYDNTTLGGLSVGSDALNALNYGLNEIGYEGGFVFGGDNPTAIDLAAEVDPRAQAATLGVADLFYQDGGTLPIVFNAVGGSYAVAEDLTTGNNTIYSQNTPKLAAYDQAEQSLPPAPTLGTPVASSGATTINTSPDSFNQNFGRPNTGQQGVYAINVSQTGVYALSVTTDQYGGTEPGQATVFVNGIQQGGVNHISASSTVSLGSVTLKAGLNVLRIYALHGAYDPAYPTDAYHYQWQPTTYTLTAAAAPVVANASFETPSVGSGGYTYNPTGGAWTFYGNSGLQSNGSAWGAASAPDGTQTAFLQANPGQGSTAGQGVLGSISQAVNFPSAGTFALSFQAARRGGQAQPVQITVDGTPVGSPITPTGSAFQPCTSVSFTVTAGSHTVALSATDNSSDQSTFIDQIALLPQ